MENIHIGKEIKERLKASGVKVTIFAEKLNTERSNVYDIFSRKSIDTELLKKIGQILSFNFFSLYGDSFKNENIKTEASAKFVIQVEISGGEAMQLGIIEKFLEILKNK